MFRIHNVLVNLSWKKIVTPNNVRCGPNGLSGRNVQLVVAEEDVKEAESVQRPLSETGDTFVKEGMTMKKKHVMKR